MCMFSLCRITQSQSPFALSSHVLCEHEIRHLCYTSANNPPQHLCECFSLPLSPPYTHTHARTHVQAVISDCVQLMAARAKAADISISLNVVGEVSTRTHTHYTMPFDTPTKQCCCAEHRLYTIPYINTAAHPVLREHDAHYKHFQKPFPLPPSQSEATQVYMVDFPANAHPPQTLVAMVTSFNSLNNAIQALLVYAETLANEVCEFCDFADIVGSQSTVIQSSVP